jgi:hypothetical protein
MPVKEGKVNLSLRLIRHQAMKMEGGVGVYLHVFLASVQNVEVCNQLHTLDFLAVLEETFKYFVLFL